MQTVIFVGTAGSGKSTLLATLAGWLEKEYGLSSFKVNLDPGCRTTPYKPDLDVREYFTVEELMEELGLGPNGAMVLAAEKLASLSGELIKRLSGVGEDYILVDTPGQMEIFVFREAGPKICSSLSPLNPVALYLTDCSLLSSGITDFAVSLVLSIAVHLRLGVPVLNVLNKADLLPREKLSLVEEVLRNPEKLKEEVINEAKGALADLSMGIAEAISTVMLPLRVVKVSAKCGMGLEDLLGLMEEVACACGDHL